MTADARIKVGISACLLGQQVRYDGGHKLSRLCAEELGRQFEFVPVCPEVGIGMGVPRKPIHLVGDAAAPRVVGVEDPGLDVTDDLREFGRRKAEELTNLCGYIFIRNSPSCGLFGVKVLKPDGGIREEGRGIYAAEITRRLPWLPVEEAGRLEQDDALRGHFLTRVRACDDWRRMVARDASPASLIGFHARYKYALMAHDPAGQKELGRLLADAGNDDEGIAGRYFDAFMRSMARPPSPGTHANALMHLAGYLRPHLDEADRRALHACIEGYRKGELPLHAPKALLRRLFDAHPHSYAAEQTYLRE